MRTRLFSWTTLGVLAISGCGTFDPQPDPTRFYLLSATPESSLNTGALDGVVLGLGPFYFAPYVDQQKIVTRLAPNEVDFDEFERWAEPFDDHFIRVLGQEIENQTDPSLVVVYPWVGVEEVHASVSVSVFRFDRTPDGGAEMEVDWAIRAGGFMADPVVARDDVFMREGPAGVGPDGTVSTEMQVEAMSRLVAQLAERISLALVENRSRFGSMGSP